MDDYKKDPSLKSLDQLESDEEAKDVKALNEMDDELEAEENAGVGGHMSGAEPMDIDEALEGFGLTPKNSDMA